MCFKKKDELYNKEVPELLDLLKYDDICLHDAKIIIKVKTGYYIGDELACNTEKIKINTDKEMLVDLLKTIRHHEAKRLLRFIRENAKDIRMEEVSGNGQE